MHYAEVAVDAPAGRSTYSYGVPGGLDVRRGTFVWVPFGPRLVRGIVVAVTLQPGYEITKPIASVVDQPPLSETQLELGDWISQHYLSPLYAALSLFAPPGGSRTPLTWLHLAEGIDVAALSLSSPERDIVERLRDRTRVSSRNARASLSAAVFKRALGALVERGIVVGSENPRPDRTRPLTETVVSLKDNPDCDIETSLKRSPRQSQVYDCLRELERPVPYGELRRLCGASRDVIRTLEGKGILETQERRVWRTPLGRLVAQEAPRPELTQWQESAWARIGQGIDSRSFSSHLLFGVTGSGKTEVYLRAAERVVAQGRRAICLVPEIALTAQTVERFMARFPGRIALLHSGLRAGEQADEWDRVQRGDCEVVVGPRSALFAPVRDLGLVVLDEEHEWTYKQDDANPRYHAREVAFHMAQSTGSTLILGSATPDVDTFWKARAGQMELLELPQRVAGGADLPPVEVADMRAELRAGNAGLFSRALSDSMTNRLARGEQVFLLLNRRGTATMMQCRRCGHVVTCPRCSVSMAYHAARERLVCHRCGHRSRIPSRCPNCSSPRLHYLGIGTQGVVEEVTTLFPDARILRWDSDIPSRQRGDGSFGATIREGAVDVVVGTQMIAKGHDFPNVTLVGVVNADVGLNIPDYKAGERVFQLLCQAAGRAGRGVRPGHVVLQTYNPEHYVVRAAANQDYRAFFNEEIAYREENKYPPLTRMVRLLYAHVNEQRAQQEAERVTAELTQRAAGRDVKVFGPVPAYLWRLRGHYRWQTTLRGSEPASLLENYPLPRGWIVDVDPVGVA